MKKAILFFLTVILFAPAIFAQQYRTSAPFTMNAEFARFRYDSVSTYVEVYYGFYPRLLSYNLADSVFKGAAFLTTVIRRADTSKTVVNERLLVPFTVADTIFRNVNATFVTQTGYVLPFGNYVLSVSAADSLMPSRQDSVSYSLKLGPVPAVTSTSDLELCSEINNESRHAKLFEKNSLEVVPNPSLVYGVTTHPVSFYYMEVYNVNTDSTYTVKEDLLDGSNNVVRQSVKNQKYTARNVVDVGMMNVSSFPSGRYQLRVSVCNQAGNDLSGATKTIFLNNPHIKQQKANPSALNATEFAGMTSDELSDEFREAQYYAKADETKRFKQLTTQESKRDFLARFWSDVENGAGGRMSIMRGEFLHRIGVANQRYHGFGKDGWQTDRGRVYLVYGEPDEVERFPSSENSKPYEVWHYYNIESGVEFDFVDRSGFGNYILVNSTKRGENQDDGWQRFLQ
ncbi:MAG TPA: GWxTD domain-containing protein [Bacteroidota bacterium]